VVKDETEVLAGSAKKGSGWQGKGWKSGIVKWGKKKEKRGIADTGVAYAWEKAEPSTGPLEGGWPRQRRK